MDERQDERQRQRMQSLFGDRRRGFLAVRYPSIIADMEKTGRLEAYTLEIAQQVLRHFEALTEQLFEHAREIADPTEREAYISEMLIEASRAVHAEIVYAAP